MARQIPGQTPGRDPYLLTPGPLTTTDSVKQVMLRDRGSRDPDFDAITAFVRKSIARIARAEANHVCVPLQGSGTFAVEAMLGTMIPRDGKTLILINGAYGHRIAKICALLGRSHEIYETAENVPPQLDELDRRLAADGSITHVVAVHCETTTGILNPLTEIARVTEARGRELLIDAMSSFGALEVDAHQIRFQAMASSANKCLEGVPGLAFVLVERAALEAAAGNAHSLVLDLSDQHAAFEKNGQWRFTPPTHVLAAFEQALIEHDREGGVAGRGARYRENCQVLIDGLRALGLVPFIDDELQAPIIVTFHSPADPNFEFETFYDKVKAQGFALYPGKLTMAETFRVGCIGSLDAEIMARAVQVIGAVLEEMGVVNRSPRALKQSA